MDFKEKKLYHQVHPLKLATDIGVTPPFLYLFWLHLPVPALLVGLIPPIVVSVLMMIWPPNLERIKQSALGSYLRRYMTPTIEAVRFLTLVPMAYGAWTHQPLFIGLGLCMLLMAWCSGLIFNKPVKP